MTRHAPTLRLMDRAVAADVLGPGPRAILWVQGCPHRCHGCIAPEGWDLRGGDDWPVDEVAAWILAQPSIDGITISGGEPMLQAGALAALIADVRRHADLCVICYTGYVLPLRTRGAPGPLLRRTAARRELLAAVDLLVDGPYVAALHADLLWRASGNQRLIPLTDRGENLVRNVADRSAGIACQLDADGRPQVVGVPPRPGFREEWERRAAQHGVSLAIEAHGRDRCIASIR